MLQDVLGFRTFSLKYPHPLGVTYFNHKTREFIPERVDDFTIQEDEETDDVWWILKGQKFTDEEFYNLWDEDVYTWFDEKWWPENL